MTDKRDQAKAQTVLQADVALVSYLDTLLAEIEVQPAPAAAESKVKANTEQADTLQERAVEFTTPCEIAVVDQSGGQTRSLAPHWATAPFQVLLFSVNGVDLAVPLSELIGILPLQGQVSQLPGQPVWAMGVALNRDAKVVVVDTRRLLMPEQAMAREGGAVYSHLLLIGDGERGLAVDALKGTEMILKEDVRWRGVGARHPWYAGMITGKLMAVIDVDGVLGMLAA